MSRSTKNKNKKKKKKKKKNEQKQNNNKKPGLTMNSDQPDHPSSLNRIPEANTTEIDSAWRMCNNVVFVVLWLTCYSCYVIS